MGKPRLIILVRHAQSEGNKNRSIHQVVPDHRVKLTDEGWNQAEEAGRRLRHLLNPDDTLQIFTSPYRRTRETTEGILRTLTSEDGDDDGAPSFSRSKIKVYEEPRLREQDFGNFQPNSAEMERMWQERADYGHFFYRIPNGESAADAYDRISGFNESLWRQFGEEDFPRVCVLVTHGLMTRVFLMKWYHWSVEYFEDLRNINHCEFIIMRKDSESGKYKLENHLRTWSQLKKERAEKEHREVREMGAFERNPSRRNTLSAFLTHPLPLEKAREAAESSKADTNEREDHALAHQEPTPHDTADGTADSPPTTKATALPAHLRNLPASTSGADTPHEMPSDDESEHPNSYFPAPEPEPAHPSPRPTATLQPQRSMAAAMRKRPPERKPTPEDIERWVQESGMGTGKQADALGDEPGRNYEGDGVNEVLDQDGAEAFGERMRERGEDESERGVGGSVY